MHQRALFIFRRDLRLEDNTGLLFALKNAKEVILSFIFTPEQITGNPYRSDRSLQFMIESLENLERDIRLKNGRLYLFFGKPEEVVAECISTLGVDLVVVNRDYTPYSIQRDQKIDSTCRQSKVLFHSFDDVLLHPPEDTLKSNGTPYLVFTPYYRNALRLNVPLPVKNPYNHYYSAPVSFAKDPALYETILQRKVHQQSGGRSAALQILHSLSQFSSYPLLRDLPAENGTTHLSPHLKFTTCSSREIYHALAGQLGPHSELVRSLYWRDFFTSIALYFPRVFGEAFKVKYNNIVWSHDPQKFQLWCEGKTGVPIVDAGMRELNKTGFMQNRVRMISASFLIKDLHIDWRWGEKYFAQKLIDYDPAVNNGNWQWVASTGCDAQPWFRIFNPWNQSLKFDPDCVYIKQWVPELAALPPKVIHKWYLDKLRVGAIDYPAPLVDHSTEAAIALKMEVFEQSR